MKRFLENNFTQKNLERAINHYLNPFVLYQMEELEKSLSSKNVYEKNKIKHLRERLEKIFKRENAQDIPSKIKAIAKKEDHIILLRMFIEQLNENEIDKNLINELVSLNKASILYILSKKIKENTELIKQIAIALAKIDGSSDLYYCNYICKFAIENPNTQISLLEDSILTHGKLIDWISFAKFIPNTNIKKFTNKLITEGTTQEIHYFILYVPNAPVEELILKTFNQNYNDLKDSDFFNFYQTIYGLLKIIFRLRKENTMLRAEIFSHYKTSPPRLLRKGKTKIKHS